MYQVLLYKKLEHPLDGWENKSVILRSKLFHTYEAAIGSIIDPASELWDATKLYDNEVVKHPEIKWFSNMKNDIPADIEFHYPEGYYCLLDYDPIFDDEGGV